VACLLFFAISLAVQAQDESKAFSEANRLYEQQKYSEAAASYEKILQDGKISTELLFNLGNACFKAGQPGLAIVAYRRAEMLSPRDPDVQANLQLARESVHNGAPPKESIWSQLINRLTLNEWAILTAAVVWILFLLLAFGQWRPDWKKTVRGYVIACAVLSASLAVCLAFAVQQQLLTKKSVVIVQEAVVRRGPFEESQSAFTVRDGTELNVLDKKENWLQIADGKKGIGWIPEAQVTVIR